MHCGRVELTRNLRKEVAEGDFLAQIEPAEQEHPADGDDDRHHRNHHSGHRRDAVPGERVSRRLVDFDRPRIARAGMDRGAGLLGDRSIEGS